MVRAISRSHALIICIALIAGFLGVPVADASREEELRAQIEERNATIEQLEREIKEYQQQVEKVSQEKQSLQSAIQTLDLSIKKFTADIRLTETRISATNLEINELSLQIGDKQERITVNTESVAETLRQIDEMESQSLLESVLSYETLADMWDSIETMQRFQSNVRDRIDVLRDLKEDFEDRKELTEQKKRELLVYQRELQEQKYSLDLSKKEKQALLTATANTEANYKKILNEKTAAREKFEQELADLEAQLQIEIDPSRIPPAGKGVLAWPLDKITITQTFGDTEFSRTGAYNGSGHNGVDFRASVGTRVKAALSGTVEGTGNTDLVKGCYSYGKWVLIKHNNGLSTLYGHLSSINVSKGDTVTTSEVIGYSGNTGFSTGPHLHFSVYASQGVQVMRLGDVPGRKVTACSNATIPVAPLNAYLNPLSYL
jgi:murein DD-endopeptidase MepM/ murein hydrolase activator NlpD